MFDPINVSFFKNSSLILISGNNSKTYMYTRELFNLDEVVTTTDWTWAQTFLPHSQDVILGTNDGKIMCLQQSKIPISDYF